MAAVLPPLIAAGGFGLYFLTSFRLARYRRISSPTPAGRSWTPSTSATVTPCRRRSLRAGAPAPAPPAGRPRTVAHGGDAASTPARRAPRHAGREHPPRRARPPGLAPPRRRGRGAGRARRAARASRRRRGGAAGVGARR